MKLLIAAALAFAVTAQAHHNPPVERYYCNSWEEEGSTCPRRIYVRGFDVRISPLIDESYDQADLGVVLSNFSAQLGFMLDGWAARWGHGWPVEALAALRDARASFYIGDPTLPDPLALERWWPCHGAGEGSCYSGGQKRIAINAVSLARRHYHGYVVMHETAHAYHHLVVEGGFLNQCVVDAYDAALAEGKYADVPLDYRRSGKPAHEGRGIREGLSIPNHVKYFAAAVTDYYWKTHTYPFDRHDLFEYDPQAYWIVRAFMEDPDAPCPGSVR